MKFIFTINCINKLPRNHQHYQLYVNVDKDTVDLVQEAMGSLGPWHVVIAIALSLVKFPVAWHQLSIVFLAPPVNFTCVSPLPATNATGQLQNQCEIDVTGNNVTFEDCVQFHYDRSDFRETIVTQVCCGFILYVTVLIKKKGCLMFVFCV